MSRRSSLRSLLAIATLATAPFLVGADGCGTNSATSCGPNGNVCSDGRSCVETDGGEPHCAGGTTCGGLLGATCANGSYCDFAPEAGCGAGDQTGVCTTEPTACTKEYAPVCGCDGATYSNACQAHASGVSVRADGPCTP